MLSNLEVFSKMMDLTKAKVLTNNHINIYFLIHANVTRFVSLALLCLNTITYNNLQ